MSDKKGNELGNGTLSWIKAEIQRSSVIRFLAYHGAHVGTALIQLHPSLPTDKVAALKKQLSAERAEIFKKRKELGVTANKLAEPWGPLKKSDNLYKDPAKFVSLMLDHFLLFVTYCVHISEFVAPSSLFERTYGSLVEDLIGLPATNEEILDEITFPENLDSITSVQMMLHLAVAYHAYRKDIKKRDMVMTAYLTLHGMELSSDFSLVMWTKAEAMFACEASFIKENKRFSLSFKSLREQEGDKPSADSIRLEKLLQNVLGKSASEDVDPDVVIVNPETGEAIPKGKVPLELHDWSSENLNEDHVALLKKEFGGYMNVTVSSLRVRKTRLEVEYVEGFCDDVGIPTDTYNSAVLGMILANLSHYGALPYIDDNEIKAVESIPETSLITSGRIARWASAAKLLVVAAFHMLSQGVVDGVVPWYESFSQVYGAFVTMGKFKEICSLINETDIMTTFTRTTPFTKLMNNNNVLIYRLTRLSTPDLVIKAVNRARQVGLLDYMDLSGLEDYVKFHKGGIAAQVASGPLKVFCCGNVNPYEPSLITEKVMIADLKPISQAPYHPKLIRQCRCILFTFDDKLNRWYQGNKAWADKDVTDSMFLSLCQQAHETMQEKSEEVMYDKKVLISKLTSVDPSNSELVDKLFKNLYT